MSVQEAYFDYVGWFGMLGWRWMCLVLGLEIGTFLRGGSRFWILGYLVQAFL